LKLFGNWKLGSPKPEELPLKEMATEIPLDDYHRGELLKDNGFTIKLLLNDECLKLLVDYGKFSQTDADSLKQIRNSLKDKKEFFEVFYSICEREGEYNYKKRGTVSIHWYYERMLLEQGLRKHGKFVKKEIKKIQSESANLSPQERQDKLKKAVTRVDEIMEEVGQDATLTMEQIEQSIKKFPNDHMYKDVKNPEEFYFRERALNTSIIKEYEKAIEFCDKGLKINPDSPFLWYMRGRTLSDMRQFEKGMEDLKKAITLREDFGDAWYEIGRIHQMNNDMDSGILAYFKANEVDPSLKIYENDDSSTKEESSRSFPKSTKTLDEKGVKIVMDYLGDAPKEIEVTVDGYFAVLSQKKFLPQFIEPPNNIQLCVYSESINLVREWVKQLTQLLSDAGIKAQFKDNGDPFQIDTYHEESKQWFPAVLIRGNDY